MSDTVVNPDRIHTLKTWPEEFQALWDGSKRFEYRHDDRGFRLGDTLLLQEYDPVTGTYSSRAIHFVVTHIVRGPAFGVPEGFVVMALRSPLVPPFIR